MESFAMYYWGTTYSTWQLITILMKHAIGIHIHIVTLVYVNSRWHQLPKGTHLDFLLVVVYLPSNVHMHRAPFSRFLYKMQTQKCGEKLNFNFSGGSRTWTWILFPGHVPTFQPSLRGKLSKMGSKKASKMVKQGMPVSRGAAPIVACGFVPSFTRLH